MNGVAQDYLALLNSLQFKLNLLAPQLPTDDQVQSAKSSLESWTNRSQSLRLSIRNANLQAKANMRKAAQEERELLLGGGEESIIRRHNLHWYDIRWRKHHREPSPYSSTDGSEESTGILRNAESEYKGHRSLLMRARNLLSTMQREDVLDRVILFIGFFFFSCAVLYVASKRIGLLKLQRAVTAAVKSDMV